MATALNAPPVNIRSVTLSASGSTDPDSYSVPSGRWAMIYIVRIVFGGSGSGTRTVSVAGSNIDSSTTARTVEMGDEPISRIKGFVLNSSDQVTVSSSGLGSSSVTAVLRIVEFNNP